MLSLPQIAFNNSDILDAILNHLLDPLFNVIFHRYSTLLVTSLISRCWYEPSQNQLHEQTLLQYGDAQLEQWLSRKEKEKYSVRELVLFDKYPFKEGGKWSYRLIEKVLNTVKGVKQLVIAFTGQFDLPANWLSFDSLANVSTLTLMSTFAPSESSVIPSFVPKTVFLQEALPRLERDWRSTCSLITRTRTGHHDKLATLVLEGFKDVSPYLSPPFPLGPDLRESARGSLLPFATSNRVLSIPNLLLSQSSFNWAIFGSGAPLLTTLCINELTPESFDAVSLLRFFPTLVEILIQKLVLIPWSGYLTPFQIEEFAKQGKGDTLMKLVFLVENGHLPNLKRISIDTWKYLRTGQVRVVEEILEAKGVEVEILSKESIPTTKEEDEECEMVRQEIQLYHQQQAHCHCHCHCHCDHGSTTTTATEDHECSHEDGAIEIVEIGSGGSETLENGETLNEGNETNAVEFKTLKEGYDATRKLGTRRHSV